MALLALVVGLSGVVSGCGDIPGCDELRVEAEPVVVDDPEQQVTFSARLVDDDGEPVAGRTVKFFLMSTGDGKAYGVQAGRAETDDDGWARLDLEGIYGPVPTGETVSRYKVDFWPAGAVDDESYCRSAGEAPITCRTAAGEGTCPPNPSPFDE